MARLRSRSGDIFLIVILLVVSAVVARNFTAAPPAKPSARVAELQRSLQRALEGYYESKAVTIELTDQGAAGVDGRARVPGNKQYPQEWVYTLLRFVAHHEPALSLNHLSVTDSSGTELYEKPPGPGPAARGQVTQDDYEKAQAERLRELGQREAGAANLVLVKVTASQLDFRSDTPARRSRIRAMPAPRQSYQIARLDLYVAGYGDGPEKVQQVVQGSLDFNQARGDTYKILKLEP